VNGKYGMGHKPGPYGTNEGDKWLGAGSDVQKLLDKEQPGVILIHEIIDGEEQIYTTRNEELIEEAKEGHEFYMAERARAN